MDALLPSLIRLAEPAGFLWLLLLGASGALLWRRRFLRAGGAGVVWLYWSVMGGMTVPAALVRSLERPYWPAAGQSREQMEAVVVLGGGLEPSRAEASGFHLTRAGDRVLAGLLAARSHRAPVLILGGGRGIIDRQWRLESETLRDWLLGSDLAGGAEVLALKRCRNTHDEALQVAALARERGWKRVGLITSAAHMRRAVATFTKAGVPVLPEPCNFLSAEAKGGMESVWQIIPNPASFELFSVWLHETAGWWEYRRRGWL